MPLNIVVGTQWGDEGKGRVVDMLSADAQIVARYNGGDNAGHTVMVRENTFKLHLIPSGIVHPHAVGVLGNGMVINPASFFSELDMLKNCGIKVDPQRLCVSYGAHIITPGHKAMDASMESHLGDGKIGTTGRGIGPAYTDKVSRHGLRVEDMLDPDLFAEKIRQHAVNTNEQIRLLFNGPQLAVDEISHQYREYALLMKPYIDDTGAMVYTALKQGSSVLAEGAQGTLLDLDLGTYPFVTSSNPTAAGVFMGLGIGVVPAGRVVGVTKAFQTRVGSGPFPTEVSGEMAERLRGTGANPWDEFGTTTGRPRRVGWLDMVLLRYAARVNGLTELVVTKLDVLSGLKSIKICTAYKLNGVSYNDLPFGPSALENFEPVYEELPGWEEDVRDIRQWDQLPLQAREYLAAMEKISGVKISMVSVGPERSQIIEQK